MQRSPLDFVGPITCRHFIWFAVLCVVSCVVRGLSSLFFSSLWVLPRTLDALLTKTNDFFFTVFTRFDHVALGSVPRSSLRLVALHVLLG